MCLMPLSTPKLGSMRLFHFTGSTLWAQLYPPTLFLAFFGLLITFDTVLPPLCWYCRRLLGLFFMRVPGVTDLMRYDWCEVWNESLWQLWGMNCMIVATCWRMIALVVDACCPFPPPDELDFVWQAQSSVTGTWVVFANNNGHQCHVAGWWFSGWKRLEIFGDPGKAIT